jgi:hypothetical protein
MVRYSIGPHEALQLLRETATEHGRFLPELAQEIATGPSQLPGGIAPALGPMTDGDLALLRRHVDPSHEELDEEQLTATAPSHPADA